jgi:hypothetical protein
MANEIYSEILAEFANGINLDVDPSVQPKGSRRYTLNTVEHSSSGKINLSNELSNVSSTVFPKDYVPIGDRYISNGETFIILQNQSLGRQSLGIVNKSDTYVEMVSTGILGLDMRYQCDIRFRIRRGNERVVYWTDGLNNARSLNLDRLYNYYTLAYKNYLKIGGDPASYTLEKWDVDSFSLIKSYNSIPSFDEVQILEFGQVEPGSYNFAIQYVDEDLNPTEWVNVSNTVNIFNDSLDLSYERIRGSRNIDSATQSFPKANKTIQLTIGHLDKEFPYYRIGVIKAVGGTGVPTKVLASALNSTYNSTFLYAGNDNELTEVAIGDILIDKEVIYQPKHLEQMENVLLLLNTKGKGINWCDFQQYASSIKSDLVTESVILNSAFDDPNVKDANYTFKFRDYMPGEVYSFAAVYVFSDGYVSPAFHIPGRSKYDNSKMLYHEIEGTYIDTHNCTTGAGGYWGFDYHGDSLKDKPVRHHRFPFRNNGKTLINGTYYPNADKPLVTSVKTSTTLNRYKLTLAIVVNPNYVPTPPDTNTGYPVDSTGAALSIGYTFNMMQKNSSNIISYSGVLTDADMGKEFTIYDDTAELQQYFNYGTSYYEVDKNCQLATYQTSSNPRFVLTPFYSPYVVDRLSSVDSSEIFGITFSNIRKPHPDVIGFYIVRQERLDEDRFIIDNGVFGAMTTNNGYNSFGLWMPKDYYPVDACGKKATSPRQLTRSDSAIWFFSPEYEYLQKKTPFTTLVPEGTYDETDCLLPTISDMDNSPCNEQASKGVYINDVQAGTTYNPDVHKKKDKDDDGFDLLVGYRNYDVAFNKLPVTGITIPKQINTTYLAAAAYQNYNSNTYYNVSVDNKIGVYVTDNKAVSPNLFHNTAGNTGRMIYCSMTRDNATSYSDFMTREYYKEHNNLIPFSAPTVNTVNIFNGDAAISATNMVSSVFYDIVGAARPKKNSLWKIITGAILIAAGIALAFVSGPAGLALSIAEITTLTTASISIGVSLITAGINFNQMSAMIQTEYGKGLKETIEDGSVYECIRGSTDDSGNVRSDSVETEDDTIRWFADRVSNVYIESTIPMGLRTGLTCGVTDFTDAPVAYDENNFRSYLTEKLTSFDRDQGSGRLYRGFASAEIYDINLDYLRFNKQKAFTHLPLEYDCLSDPQEIYPKRIWQSQQSFQEELTDNYHSFLPNNYVDIEGEHGDITGCYKLGNNLYIQTAEATWQLPQHQQERVTNEIVSFIGTGTMFDILPRKIVDDDKGSLGTLHKWANCKTRMGMLSVSTTEHKIFFHADKITEISEDGLRYYCMDNIREFLATQLDSIGLTFTNTNNPYNPYGTGYHSTYDPIHDRVLITKKDYLLLPDKLDSLVVCSNPAIRPVSEFCFNTIDQCFYQGANKIPFTDRNYFEDKSFTLSFSLITRKWVSWHSYLPTFYLHAKEAMFSYIPSYNNLWKHNQQGTYHTFYNIYYPHILEGVLKSESLSDIMFEDITIRTRAYFYSNSSRQYAEKRFVTFNKVTIYNERQCSGELYMDVKETKPNPQFYLTQQTARVAGSIIIDKIKENWNINGFRDYIIDYNDSLFTSDWLSISTQYPIDKVVNGTIVSFNKDWMQLETFKGRYVVFRLKFDNFDSVNLITDFLLSTTQVSL